MSNSLRFSSSAAISNHEGVQVCSSRILHFRDLTPFFAFVPTSFNNIPCSISTKWFIRELKRLFTCFVILRWRTKVPALEVNDEEYTSNRNRKPFWILLSGSFQRQPSWRRSESDHCFQSTSRIDIDWGCIGIDDIVDSIHSFDSAKTIDIQCASYISRSQRQIDLRKYSRIWFVLSCTSQSGIILICWCCIMNVC